MKKVLFILSLIVELSFAPPLNAQEQTPVNRETTESLSWINWLVSRFSYEKALTYHVTEVEQAYNKALIEHEKYEKELKEVQKNGTATEIALAENNLSQAQEKLEKAKQEIKEIRCFYKKWNSNTFLDFLNILLCVLGAIYILLIFMVKKGNTVISAFSAGAVVAIIGFICSFTTVSSQNIFSWKDILCSFLLIMDMCLLILIIKINNIYARKKEKNNDFDEDDCWG